MSYANLDGARRQASKVAELDLSFPVKFQPLFEPHRLKIFHGGRGGGKTWSFARALLLRGRSKPQRVLCTREYQSSIAESVHQTLSVQIENLNLQSFYKIEKATIWAANGSEFFFEGLHRNFTKIKSYEGIDVAWLEEAETLPEDSWDVLEPTIRKENSEIWASLNVGREYDFMSRMIRNPPDNAIVVQVNYYDNPFCPASILKGAAAMRVSSPDKYLHIYEGFPKITLDGAVYADEIRSALAENRVCAVPYDQTVGCDVFFDLGMRDKTCIVIRQKVGFEYHYIDYYENSGKGIQHYLMWLQSRPYIYNAIYLPHDGKARELGSGMSIEEQFRAAGKLVMIVPKLSIVDGIAAARAIFTSCWFDQKRCEGLLMALKNYSYLIDPASGLRSKTPLHNEYSHGADAFRYSAIKAKQGLIISNEARAEKIIPVYTKMNAPRGEGSWMM